MGPPREHGGMVKAFCWALASSASLQWGRRVNTAEWHDRAKAEHGRREASMGPPREHGGMLRAPAASPDRRAASMGPPGEHGGMRNVHANQPDVRQKASMGPPREHGGMFVAQERGPTSSAWLQWGRRVNTAEWRPRARCCGGRAPSFNGAAA